MNVNPDPEQDSNERIARHREVSPDEFDRLVRSYVPHPITLFRLQSDIEVQWPAQWKACEEALGLSSSATNTPTKREYLFLAHTNLHGSRTVRIRPVVRTGQIVDVEWGRQIHVTQRQTGRDETKSVDVFTIRWCDSTHSHCDLVSFPILSHIGYTAGSQYTTQMDAMTPHLLQFVCSPSPEVRVLGQEDLIPGALKSYYELFNIVLRANAFPSKFAQNRDRFKARTFFSKPSAECWWVSYYMVLERRGSTVLDNCECTGLGATSSCN